MEFGVRARRWRAAMRLSSEDRGAGFFWVRITVGWGFVARARVWGSSSLHGVGISRESISFSATFFDGERNINGCSSPDSTYVILSPTSSPLPEFLDLIFSFWFQLCIGFGCVPSFYLLLLEVNLIFLLWNLLVEFGKYLILFSYWVFFFNFSQYHQK